MSLEFYTLTPTAPLHLGVGRAGDLTDIDYLPRSDTIAAAVLSVWRLVTPGEDISALAARMPFALSSALPTLSVDGTRTVLLPIPAGLLEFTRLAGATSKQLRHARHAPAGMLTSMLEGRALGECAVVSGCVLDKRTAAAFPRGLWQDSSRLRLAVSRVGDGPIEGLLYDFGAVTFAEGVSLGLAVEFREPAVQPRFEAALAMLAAEGLGGDRSAGYGRFEITGPERFSPSLGGGMRLCLSLLHPTADELRGGLLDPPASYEMIIRGGWVTAPGAAALRKKMVRMLAEGSVLRDIGKTCCGDSPVVLDPLPHLGLTHTVFRPGVAVTVPISTICRGDGTL